MRAIRIVLASLLYALYRWVNPRKKPGPPKGYKRKAKQAAPQLRTIGTMACPGCEEYCEMPVYRVDGRSDAWIICDKEQNHGRIKVAPPAPVDADQIGLEVVSAEAVNA